MKREFIPYEEALVLKELGFDEPCIGFYYDKTKFLKLESNPEHLTCKRKASYIFGNEKYDVTLAPLYQQAFKWFRENHKLFPLQTGNEYYSAFSLDMKFLSFVRANKNVNHFEQAELECLRKLIEIVKNKK